jgi:LuxR family maltose regulon positive regulatory protein
MAHAEHWVACAERALGGHADPPVAAGLALLRAVVVRHDLDAVRAHAAAAAEQLDAGDPWFALCRWLQGVGATAAGHADAGDRLEEGVRAGIVDGPWLAALCEAELALAALCDAEWEHGACLAERARARVEHVSPGDRPMLALVVAVAAFARAHRGRFAEARADVALARAAVSDPDGLPPWLLAHVDVALARAELRLSVIAEGREILAAGERLTHRLTGAPVLAGWVHEARRCADTVASAGPPPTDPLTAAELRVLRHLTSHLTFREIGALLYVSPHTIKSQAHAIYRKLGATSRSAAVERARALGLLGGTSSAWADGPRARAS